MYFLLPDRFSDGNETGYKDIANRVVNTGTTPLFKESDRGNAINVNDDERNKWLHAGGKFVGGKIRGIISKLGYLKRMGVTTLWIGPIFKQIADLETYHGYGIQDFLDVEPRFGTREDLKDLVKAAHAVGIYVLLDVVLNHAGDVFGYKDYSAHYDGTTHENRGFWAAKRDENNMIPLGLVDENRYPDAWPDGAIWPAELQSADCFGRKGTIRDFDKKPEFIEGDFFGLKKLNLGAYDPAKFTPTTALQTLTDCFKFWIAFADVDGFRIVSQLQCSCFDVLIKFKDTVKHMGDGPTRYFASTIHSYAHLLGKKNFFLVGECSTNRPMETVAITGLNAALGIGDFQRALTKVPKNQEPASNYFDNFVNSPDLTKGWARNQIVTMIDDHDQIWQPFDMKWRFCSDAYAAKFLHATLGMNLCTMGIPCIYYGTEQRFDGAADKPDPQCKDHFADQFIREAMFGGPFGAFGSQNRHFFDESTPTYRIIHDLTQLRSNQIALRRGSQYLCTVSSASMAHRIPCFSDTASRHSKSVVAWLRACDGEELLCALNTNADAAARAWVHLPKEHQQASKDEVMRCVYPPRKSDAIKVVHKRGGLAKVWITIPSAGFVVYKLSRSKSSL